MYRLYRSIASLGIFGFWDSIGMTPFGAENTTNNVSFERFWRTLGPDVERRHFSKIPHDQTTVRDDRMVPAPAINRMEPRDFVVALGRRLDERDFSIFGEHDQMIASEQ